MSGDRIKFWLLVAGLGASTVYSFWYAFKAWGKNRLIEDTPISRIRSAAQGYVELSGEGRLPPDAQNKAPLSGIPCTWWRYKVEERSNSRESRGWSTVDSGTSEVSFLLDDGTGRCLIDPRGADLDIHRDFQQEFCDSFFTTKDPVPDNVRSFLFRQGITTNHKIKVEEFCIKPKNALFILGTLAENPGIELTSQPNRDLEGFKLTARGGFSLGLGASLSAVLDGNFPVESRLQPIAAHPEAQLGQVVRLSSESIPARSADMTQQQKIAAALLKAGISNPAAWSAAGMESPAGPANQYASVITDHSPTEVRVSGMAGSDSAALEPDGFDPHPPVVLMKGASNKTFLISWRSQQDIARSLGWKCTLMIWGGPALALLSFYVLLSIESWR